MNIIPLSTHYFSLPHQTQVSKNIEFIAQIALKLFQTAKNVFFNKWVTTTCIVCLSITTFAMLISKITSLWMAHTQQEVTKSRYMPISFLKSDSVPIFQSMPCPSPTDLRDVSPTIQMPVGFPFLPSNCGFISTLQFLCTNSTVSTFIETVLGDIALKPQYLKNSFLRFVNEKNQKIDLAIDLAQKVETTQKEAVAYLDAPLFFLELKNKINLKTVYFGLSPQKAAKIALYLIQKWKGTAQTPPCMLSIKELQLLRMALVRLIHSRNPTKVVLRGDQQELQIPGLHFGINPFNSHWIEPAEFSLNLLQTLSHMNDRHEIVKFNVMKEKSHIFFEAKGLEIGKKIRTNTKIEQTLSLKASLSQPFSIDSFMLNFEKEFDSRGVYDTAAKKFRARPLEIFLNEEIPYTNSKSQSHEQLKYKLRLNQTCFIHFEIFDTYETKISVQPIVLQDLKSFSTSYQNLAGQTVNLSLDALIVHLGPNKQAAHYVSYIRKHSACGQKIFFKCDDSTISIAPKEEIQEILHGRRIDPIWGQATCLMAQFSVS